MRLGEPFRPATDPARESERVELLDLIAARSFSVVYQPIVDLRSGSVIGHEALCRGPAGTAYAAAEHLFATSHALGLAHELDEACRAQVFGRACLLGQGTKLFVNILPGSVADGRITAVNLGRLLPTLGILPGQVVLELSERVPIVDAALLSESLAPFREAGFLVAMDDIGAGFWSLRLVPEVAPHFMKVDISLVRGLSASVEQQGAVGAIVEMAARHGAEVICEGIEQALDLEAVVALGVRYGQGFLLAAPAHEPVAAVERAGS